MFLNINPNPIYMIYKCLNKSKISFICILLLLFYSCAVSDKEVLKISYLGPRGSFTHLAAQKQFPDQILISETTIEDCFLSVQTSRTNKAVVPFKNSIGGIVISTKQALEKFPEIHTESSLELPISQNLMVNFGTTKIERIYSHDQALKQCEKFLDSLYPSIPRIEFSSTAAAAKWVSENPMEKWGAIANAETAKIYKLYIKYYNIQNSKNNKTQFIIISR